MTGKKNKIAPYDILLHMYFCNFVESQFGLGSVVLIAVAVISFGLSLQCCMHCLLFGCPVPFLGMMLPLFVCKC